MENLKQVTERAKCESICQKVLLVVGFVMLSASFVLARSPKIARELQGKVPSDRVDVIVQFTKTPTARHHQRCCSKGGTLNRELSLVKAGSYSVPASELAALAADPC
jgi:hypothetical protein